MNVVLETIARGTWVPVWTPQGVQVQVRMKRNRRGKWEVQVAFGAGKVWKKEAVKGWLKTMKEKGWSFRPPVEKVDPLQQQWADLEARHKSLFGRNASFWS